MPAPVPAGVDAPHPQDIILHMDLNAPAADFELCDVEGRPQRLKDQRGRIVILNFWSCECPHSERTDRALMELCSHLDGQVALISVASNRTERPETVVAVSRSRRLPVVLLDPDHAVADLYAAQTTPEVFVIDRAGLLRYRGAVDDVTFRQSNPFRSYVQEAVEALLRDELPVMAETPAHGCAIVREALE
jgi:thiol-disulfide isomerase/thioredoxin